jgi:hypothetical protein
MNLNINDHVFEFKGFIHLDFEIFRETLFRLELSYPET